MGELEQRIHNRAEILDAERGILENLLDGEYFKGCKGSIKLSVRELEGRRDSAFTALGKGFVQGTAAEAGRFASLISLYGDGLVYLGDALTTERDRCEQYIRTQVQGPMSGTFDDYYGLFGVLGKEMNLPDQDIDNLTDECAGRLSTHLANLGALQVKLCDTLNEIGKARLALDSIVRVQVQITRVRLAAFQLERMLHALRLELAGDRIAIVEE